jgi:nitrogen fixation protein FixH
MTSTDQTQSSRRPREVTGRMVLICLLAFFGLIAAMNAVLIRLAISTFGGVETENAYQAGLNFSRDIAAAETQNALQWQVKATVSTGPDATVVELVSRDADGRVLAGLDANARLVHPTDRRFDVTVPLDERVAGTFRGQVAGAHGNWILVIDLMRDGTRVFRSRNRVFLR